jgi:predicted RNase H-like HicB family nuclease
MNPAPQRTFTRTFVFPVELIAEEDGRWSAIVPDLPGCSTWGYTREQALTHASEAATAYVLDMREVGEEVPVVAAVDGPTATVTV